MIERPLGYVALSAPFAGVAIELVPHFPGASVAVASAACGALAVGLLTFLQRDAVGLPNVLLAAALVAVAVGATVAPGSFGPYGPAIFVGLLVGGPFVLAGYVARAGGLLGARFVAYGVSVTWGLFLLANASSAVGNGPSAIASSYAGQFFSLVAQQFQVFGGLLTGAATPPLPLNQFFDPTYSALVAFSLVGLLLASTRPQTGSRAPLPVAVRAYRSVDSERELSGAYGFTPTQQQVFRERSTGETPLATWPPGIEPVFYGATAAAAFLLVSYFLPTWAVAGAVGAVAVIAVWLLRSTDRPVATTLSTPPPPAIPDGPGPPPSSPDAPGAAGPVSPPEANAPVPNPTP